MIALTTTWAYLRAYDRYYEKVSKYFLDKYLAQAIENGFEDYQISKWHILRLLALIIDKSTYVWDNPPLDMITKIGFLLKLE